MGLFYLDRSAVQVKSVKGKRVKEEEEEKKNKKKKRKKKERKKNLLASKINLIKAPSKLRISSGWKQRIGKKGKQPSSLLARSKNFQVRGEGKRGGLEARGGREPAENSGALPYPITMADVGFLAEYLSETFFNQVFDQCLLFLVFIVFARRQSGVPRSRHPFQIPPLLFAAGFISRIDLTLRRK